LPMASALPMTAEPRLRYVAVFWRRIYLHGRPNVNHKWSGRGIRRFSKPHVDGRCAGGARRAGRSLRSCTDDPPSSALLNRSRRVATREHFIHDFVLTGERKPRSGHREMKCAVLRLAFASCQQALCSADAISLCIMHNALHSLRRVSERRHLEMVGLIRGGFAR
jgi:hypothetical protein